MEALYSRAYMEFLGVQRTPRKLHIKTLAYKAGTKDPDPHIIVRALSKYYGNVLT